MMRITQESCMIHDLTAREAALHSDDYDLLDREVLRHRM